MPAVIDKIQYAGDVIWDSCDIVNYANKSASILAMINELNIYEDMYSPTMHGEAVIVDTNNFVSEFPIIGQEIMFISFRTPSQIEEQQTKAFRITKIGEKIVEGNKQIYRIFFVSLDAYLDICSSENRTIKGTADVIIKSTIDRMWNDYGLPEEILTNCKPKQFFKTPKNHLSLTSPTWSPIRCVNWATKRALNDKNVADWVYYETLKGNYFLSLGDHLFNLDNLFSDHDNDVQGNYTYDQSTSFSAPDAPPDLDRMYSRIHRIQYFVGSDQMTSIMNRHYSQKVVNHDLFFKNVHAKVHSIEDALNEEKYPRMNNDSLIAAPKEDRLFRIADDAYVTVANTYPYRFKGMQKDLEQDMKMSRLVALNKLNMQKIVIDVWGRSDLRIGHKLAIHLGNYSQIEQAMVEGDDYKTSGIFLITAICHRLSPTQHKMTIELCRDSTPKKQEAMQ